MSRFDVENGSSSGAVYDRILLNCSVDDDIINSVLKPAMIMAPNKNFFEFDRSRFKYKK
jgi:hypothetical protein